METNEAIELARRLVACRHYRPGNGTVTLGGRVLTGGLCEPSIGAWYAYRYPNEGLKNGCSRWASGDSALPDLRAAATRGNVLENLRGVFGASVCVLKVNKDHVLYPASGGEWVVWTVEAVSEGVFEERWMASGSTEAEAMVAAAELAHNLPDAAP